MPKTILFALILCAGLAVLAVLVYALLLTRTLKFAPVQNESIHSDTTAPRLPGGAAFRVLSWNVQYMAGKNHVFWYDLQGNRGPDTRPTSQELKATLAEVARVIRENNPDVILLQELDDNSTRSDHKDQLQELRALLPDEYRHYASAFYWQAGFVPHPRIMGSVGMKLSVLSRYPIHQARRHALADVPRSFLTQPFNIRRAVLEVRLRLDDGREVAVLNTHLEAFVQGSPVMQRQVMQLDSLLRDLNAHRIAWVAGGDLNLLPPGEYAMLHPNERWLYNPESEMQLLYRNHHVLPTLEQVQGDHEKDCRTHYPNRPWSNEADRTIDYLLYSPELRSVKYGVLQQGTSHISDHFPVIGDFALK